MTGSVAIHIAFSLQVSCGAPQGMAGWAGRGAGAAPVPPHPGARLPRTTPPCALQRLYYVKEAHGIVVTDVAFVPESRGGQELLAGNEAALLSVAVDSRCKLHLVPSRRRCPGVPPAQGQAVFTHTPACMGGLQHPSSSPFSPQAPFPSGCCCCSAPGSSWSPSYCCSSPSQGSCSPLDPQAP